MAPTQDGDGKVGGEKRTCSILRGKLGEGDEGGGRVNSSPFASRTSHLPPAITPPDPPDTHSRRYYDEDASGDVFTSSDRADRGVRACS